MKKYLLLTGLVLVTLLLSCTKKINDNNSNFKGVWSMVSHSVQFKSDIQSLTNGFQFYDDTVFNYTTSNNSGTVTITSDSISSTDLAYSVADTLYIHQFADSVATSDTLYQDHQYIFVEFSTSYTNSSLIYQQIGEDSLYFPSGITYNSPDTAGGLRVQVYGAKISVVGNQLTLTSVVDQSYPYPYDIGVPGALPVYHVNAVIKTIFERK
jgi:hypothetical protein